MGDAGEKAEKKRNNQVMIGERVGEERMRVNNAWVR